VLDEVLVERGSPGQFDRVVAVEADGAQPRRTCTPTTCRCRWPRSVATCTWPAWSHPRRPNDPKPPTSALPPNSPTNAGKPTSPTGGWPTTPTWKSCGSMTTPATPSQSPPTAASPAPSSSRNSATPMNAKGFRTPHRPTTAWSSPPDSPEVKAGELRPVGSEPIGYPQDCGRDVVELVVEKSRRRCRA
jgi:hypothetical protein